jgi:hypothetical protein
VFDDGLRLRDAVPQGHKVALANIAAAEPVLRCGVAIDAAGAEVPIRTLCNLSLNPNFGGEVMVVSLGCEKLQPERFKVKRILVKPRGRSSACRCTASPTPAGSRSKSSRCSPAVASTRGISWGLRIGMGGRRGRGYCRVAAYGSAAPLSVAHFGRPFPSATCRAYRCGFGASWAVAPWEEYRRGNQNGALTLYVINAKR